MSIPRRDNDSVGVDGGLVIGSVLMATSSIHRTYSNLNEFIHRLDQSQFLSSDTQNLPPHLPGIYKHLHQLLARL